MVFSVFIVGFFLCDINDISISAKLRVIYVRGQFAPCVYYTIFFLCVQARSIFCEEPYSLGFIYSAYS